MSILLFLLTLFIQFSLYICGNNSDCSLSFNIQTIYQSNQIPTDFPIEFLANYNLTCNVKNVTAYYKIIPFAILIVDQYKTEEENINNLYNFWNLPMKIFYICLICSISIYYILFFLRDKWRKGGKKLKLERPVSQPTPDSEKKNDTFENEKVQEEQEESSDEDQE